MPMGGTGAQTVPSWHSEIVKPLHPFVNALRDLCFKDYKGQQLPQLREALMSSQQFKDYKAKAEAIVGDYWCLKCKFWGHTYDYQGCPHFSK